MENNKLVHRSITWYLWKREKHAAEIHRELVDVCGDGAPSDRTVRRWLEDFKEGKSSPEDEQSPGRPATATTTENIAVIKNLISDDPRITVTELSTATGNSVGTIWGILHDHLNLSKLTCRWIPKLLTADMKRNRVDISRTLLEQYNAAEGQMLGQVVTGDEKWFYYYDPDSKQQSKEWRVVGSPPPLKVAKDRSAGKRMASVFWDSAGILLIDWLPEKRSITADYYCELLIRLKESIKNERRGKWTRGVLLLHDNARPHTAARTQATIRELGFNQLPHPAYSPDLAPSDYWLFGEMAKQVRGRRWANIQELSGALGRWANQADKDWFARGIAQLPERWERCVNMQGAYVEAMAEDADQ